MAIASLGGATAAAATSALELFQANLGEKQNEPTQTALRWVVELAAYDLLKELKGTGAVCDEYLVPGGGAPAVAVAPAASPAVVVPVRKASAEPASAEVATLEDEQPAKEATARGANSEPPSPTAHPTENVATDTDGAPRARIVRLRRDQERAVEKAAATRNATSTDTRPKNESASAAPSSAEGGERASTRSKPFPLVSYVTTPSADEGEPKRNGIFDSWMVGAAPTDRRTCSPLSCSNHFRNEEIC